jgi:hypothetical protein
MYFWIVYLGNMIITITGHKSSPYVQLEFVKKYIHTTFWPIKMHINLLFNTKKGSQLVAFNKL